MRGILLTFLLGFGGFAVTKAQLIPIAYTGTGTPYVQNFDGLPSAGTFTLNGKGPFNLSASPINATNLNGWQVFMPAGTNPSAAFAVSTGSSTGNAVYSLGTAATTDRALGSLSSGTGIYSMGLVLTNQTGGLLNSFTVSFTAEQWRKGGSGSKNVWSFRYKTGNITQIDQTGLLDDTTLNFSSVITTTGGSSLNGNLPENRQAISYTVKGILWKPGEQLLLRWDDADEAGIDDAVGMDNFSFSATLQSAAPAISNIAATSITANSAQLTGTVNDNFATTSVFFEYDTSIALTTKKTARGTPDTIKAGAGNTNVSANLSDLTPGTIYYYRIKATNTNGSITGGIQNFTTLVSLPTVVTGVAFSVTTNTAMLGGNVSNSGGATITEKGIVWSTNNNPGITDNKIKSGDGPGIFSQLIDGLPEAGTVYARAYAINSGGVAYGDTVRFITQTSITQFSATGSIKTNASSVGFNFKTAKNINGLNTANFLIQPTGISGTSITSVTGTANSFTITVHTGTGDGKLGLLFINDSGISVPISNKPFLANAQFIIDKTPPQIIDVSIPDKAMIVNDTVSVNIKVKPDADILKMTTGILDGFNLTGFSKKNDSLYSAVFIITNGGKDIDSIADIPVSIFLTDSIGNMSAAFNDSIKQSFDLIDANKPFIISTQNPQKGIYKIGDTLNFTFRFSERIIVTNSISTTLSLTVGTRSRSALYISGSGTDSLVFRYIVASGDLDKDGIKTGSSIATGTGFVKDLSGNTATLGFSNTLATKQILIDGVVPTITGINVPAAGVYRTGNLVDFMVNFSKKVYVDESVTPPILATTIGSRQKYAAYISGSGSTALLFRYTVMQDDIDTNGIKLISPLIDSSLSIKDSIGNKAVLALANIGSMSGVKVNPPTTFIESVLVPPAGTYKTGDTLDFLINYNERVWISNEKGNPSLKIITGSGTKQAYYSDGSGGNTLFFSYAVQPGDEDTDGIQLNNFITLNNGSIKNENGYMVPLVLNNVGNTNRIFIDGVAPSIKSVTIPSGKIYKTGDTLDFVFRFTEKINASSAISSSTLSVTIGLKNTTAKYALGNKSDSIVYRYIIEQNDLDKDGIKTGNLLVMNNTIINDLNGNPAETLFTMPSTKNIIVDALRPVLLSFTTPLSGIYKTGNTLDFVFNYSKKVFVTNNTSPFVAMKIGTQTKNIFYTRGSGTNSLVFSYRVEADDTDSSGIQMILPVTDFSSLLKDSLGNISEPINIPIVGPKNIYINPLQITVIQTISPQNSLYKTGDTLQFLLRFSEPVLVSTKNGIPTLSLKINTASRQAAFVNGSGSSSLLFRYIIQPGEEDMDGIEIDSILSLNNGSIQNARLIDVSTQINNSTIKTGILIDAVSPTIKQIQIPVSGIYKSGDSLDFLLRFSERIYFTNGFPSLPLTIGTKARVAVYVSGNGSDSLLFRYKIVNGDIDLDGIKLGSFSLNNAVIKDLAGNQALVNISIPSSKEIIVDAVVPLITSVSVPAAGIYKINDTLIFGISFSKKMFIKNSDIMAYITIEIDSTTRQVNYLKGSGSTFLLFGYRIKADDIDTNGISIHQLLNDINKTVSDSAGNSPELILNSIGNTSGILINPPAINITNLTTPVKGIYKTGDTLKFQISYSESVVVSTKNGIPGLHLTIGSLTKQATYINGSGGNTLFFRYIVQTGDEDIDGIETDTVISLNNGTIRNIKSLDALIKISNSINKTEIFIDAINPFIKTIQIPVNGIYKSGDSLDFVFKFSERIYFTNGSPSLPLTIGTKGKTAVYVSGNESDSLLFRYRILNGDIDLDGIKTDNLSLNNSTLKDKAGNIAALNITSSLITKDILVDAVAPVINSVTVPASANYKTGDTLHFVVNFSEKIFLTKTDSLPSIFIQMGSFTKAAGFVNGSGNNALTFRYIVQNEDIDTNGIKLNAVLIDATNTIKDSAGNKAILVLNNIGNTSGIKINPPLISFIQQASFPQAGIYKTGDSLWVTILFSDIVLVNTANNSPYIKFTVGSSAKQAKYAHGSGTDILSFLYIIQSGDLDKDGITINNSITLNGSEIKNGKGNQALLSFSVPTIKNIFIDAIKPTITAVTVPSATIYKTGNILDFMINFSEKVYVTGSGILSSLPLTIGNTLKNALYINGSGSNSLLFRYNVQADDIDNDGIKLSSAINSNDGSIIDSAGNTASLILSAIPSKSGIIINPAVVSFNSVITPSEKTYKTNDTLEFLANYSEPVFVNSNNGNPSIKITINNIVKQAFYINGSGTNYLIFRYVIQSGDIDIDGVRLANSLSLNNGTIKDARGNNAPIILPETVNTSNILIDALAPVIINSISSAAGIYKAGDTIGIQLIFSEPIIVSDKDDSVRLLITIGSSQKNMNYYYGSGTDKLGFRYIIQSGDLDKNGVSIGSSIVMQNNTIKDLAGNPAINSFKTNNAFAGIKIDAVAPLFVSINTDTIQLCENSIAVKINSVLTVADNETGEILTWKIKNTVSHGSISTQTQTANSNGKTVQCPAIEYEPYSDYFGYDSLTVEVSDGINTLQKKILLYIQPHISNNKIGSAKLICTDQTPGLFTGSIPLGGDGLYKFSWEVSTATDSSIFVAATGANRQRDYVSPILTNNTWFRRKVLSGTCSDTSETVKITVLKNGVWTGNSNNDWKNSNNWCGNKIPDKSTDVLINDNTLYQPQIRDTVWCNQLTLSNATHLKIEGVLKVNNTINAIDHSIDAANGTIIFSGTSPQKFSGNLFEEATIQNLVIQNSSGVTITDSLSVAGTILLQAGSLNTNDHLTLKEAAVIGPSATGTSVNGIVSIEHRIEGGRRVYQIVGNPFTQDLGLYVLKDSVDITGEKGSANGFTNTATNQASAFWYDPLNGNDSAEIEAGWKPFTHTNGLGENAWKNLRGIRFLMRGKPGQGLDGTPAGDGRNGTYLPDPAIVKLSGNIHTGDQEVSLQKNDHATYHVISNPYVSNIDLSFITKGKDIAANYWIWNPLQGIHGGYTSFPFRTKYILPPLGAFIAKATGNQFNTLLFTENMKTTEPFINSMNLTDMKDIFHVELRLETDSIYWDRILLLQMDSAKIFLDRNDAEKFWNSDVNFYSVSRDNKILSIDARPMNNESTIPLGIQTEEQRNFDIRITKSNLPPSNTLQLHDKYLNKWMPLDQDSSYSFTTTKDTLSFGNERFEITSIKKSEDNSVLKQRLRSTVHPIPVKDNLLLQYNAAEAGNTSISIMSLSGTVLKTISLGIQKQGQVMIPVGNLLNGIYLLEIKCGNEISTQKIIKE